MQIRQILILIIFFTSRLSYGQSFEGTLTYVSDFEVSEKLVKMDMTKQKLLEKMKQDGSWSDTIRTSYKRGNYYTLLNSKQKSWAIYIADSNKIYSMQEGEASDICTVTDASIDLEFAITGKMPTIQKLDTTVDVNGVPCNIVRVRWKSGTHDYYYNSTKLIVNPLLFEKHIYDGWADFLKISKSLPIRIVKSTNGMITITMTLVSEKKEIIEDKLFSIPTLVYDKDLNIIKIPNREIMRIYK